MTFEPFSISRLPQILFGSGTFGEVVPKARALGRRLVVLTGSASFTSSRRWANFVRDLDTADVSWRHGTVAGEPSPDVVDALVARFRHHDTHAVVAIGGGSVLDTAKAVAGLLPFGNSVLDHLEGVGAGVPYRGPALPFIAVPTTAGTGSEATKNAVLSVQGPRGYKKSFRHDTLVPTWAIVDPDLLDTCPPELIAANGMDAFTQLLESYVSSRANAFTDALAVSGLEAVAEGFFAAWAGGDSEFAQRGRSQMAYGALLSGITLAQAGLGSVHGLASPLGAFFPISHGVACGCTLAEATAVNIAALRERDPEHPALAKYASVGRLLAALPATSDDTSAQQRLVATLQRWTTQLRIPRLSAYGVTPEDFPRIVANSRGNSMQTNPIRLGDEEIAAILHRCM
jgi:alcohol dehydrogenase